MLPCHLFSDCWQYHSLFPASAEFTPFPRAARCIQGSGAPHFSKFTVLQTTCAILLNVDSDSVGLRWDLEFCLSNKLPGDADAAGLGPYFEKQASSLNFLDSWVLHLLWEALRKHPWYPIYNKAFSTSSSHSYDSECSIACIPVWK